LVEGLNSYYDWTQEMHPRTDGGVEFTDGRDIVW